MNDLSKKQKRLVLVLFFAVVIGSASLLYRSFSRNRPEEVIDLEFAGEPGLASSGADWRVTVHLCGAVREPGVYTFELGSRLYQALEEAGGYLPEAAINTLNLAAPLKDGERIYIPYQQQVEPSQDSGRASTLKETKPTLSSPEEEGDSTPAEVQTRSSPAPLRPAGVDPNTATCAELESISGIGPVLASRIIDYRLRHGRFQTLDDLLQVKGIGHKTLEKIKDYLVIVER